MSYTVGIDLGTTRSVIAHVPKGSDRPEAIDNSGGEPVTPSAVFLTEDGNIVVGDEATDQAVMHPDRYVEEVKRFIGEDKSLSLGQRSKNPEEISALILQKLVQDAGERVGSEVTNVVITVPAYFTERQRRATANAGEIAGLNVERLLAEPSAAVFAYGLRKQKLDTDSEEIVFVYDLGGGTFDATLVRAKYDVNYVETLATDGDSELGGSDWTARVEDLLITEIKEDTGVDLRTEPGMDEQYQRVRKTARDAKHRLSEQSATNVTVPYVIPQDGYNLDMKITREEFEEATSDLLKATRDPIDRVFSDSDISMTELDTVLLVGGSTRMPQVETFVEEYFEMPPSKEISPDKAVALGAAAQASLIDDSGQTGGITIADDDSNGSNMTLIDVIPQALGVETYEQRGQPVFSRLIEKNTTTPTRERRTDFGVMDPKQTSIATRILQGDSDNPDQNEELGELRIDDIPPRDPSENSIATEFKITKDGTITAQAEDLKSGKEVTTTIEGAVRRDDDDIERMNNSLPPVE